MALLDLLGRRWSMRILWELSHTHSSFRELQRRCNGVSSSVLNTRLSELKTALLIDSRVDGYYLTELGEQLMTHISPLRQWAEQWGDELERQSS